MLKMKDLLQEGRKIQESFKKRMSINEGSAVLSFNVYGPSDRGSQGNSQFAKEMLNKHGIKCKILTDEYTDTSEIEIDEKVGPKALAVLAHYGIKASLNVVYGKTVKTTGDAKLPASAKGGSVILNVPVFDAEGAYSVKDEANFALEVLKKKGIKAEIVKSTFTDEFSIRVAKADAKKAIQVLSDNGMEIEG